MASTTQEEESKGESKEVEESKEVVETMELHGEKVHGSELQSKDTNEPDSNGPDTNEPDTTFKANGARWVEPERFGSAWYDSKHDLVTYHFDYDAKGRRSGDQWAMVKEKSPFLQKGAFKAGKYSNDSLIMV